MILNNALLLVLLVLAVAAGWTLGRGGLRMDGADRAQLPSQYYRGFNFLLDGEEDDAVDAFTEALSVNEDTVDTHIALGSVLRKRGEVDRAIRIHQNLLKRPQLTTVQLHQSHLELARDFIAAGLYDRAEQLLSDLTAQSTEFSAAAQRHLLDVHEERDWPLQRRLPTNDMQAEEGGQSATGQDPPAQQLRGHYLCEQADAALESGDKATAGEFYEAALRDQNQDLRARMGLAKLRLSAGDPETALTHFRVIMGSGRNCTPELLALLSEICAARDNESQYLAALEEYYALQSSSLLALALAGELEKQRGRAAAEDFLRKTLTTHPSVSVAASLVLQGLQSDTSLPEREVFDRLTSAAEGYQCGHCGFTGKARHWRCPGCRHWDAIHYRGEALEQTHG